MKLQGLAISCTYGVFLGFRTIVCGASGCSRISSPQLGHEFCAEHCLCLRELDDEFVYDPLRCDLFLDFIRGRFQGVTVIDDIKSGSAELECHMK